VVGVLYPNAYHIKVAVRDGASFWLSSGNWQGSNQPEADATKLDVSAQRQLLSGRNREWHIVSDNKKLAQTFEAYIKYDVAGAKQAEAEGGERGVIPPALPELVLPAEAELRAPAKAVKIFPARKFAFTAADSVRVQPILTPDNYGEHVVKLIRSAKKTLYFQNQYIKIPKAFPDGGGKPALKELVGALLDRMEAGVDVRIILRNEGDTRSMLQALKAYGFDMTRVKLLGGCHNKGIVVDSAVVLVSSQNYSADGVRYNRDAGLIISHPKVAKYFEQIFLYDWDVRATQRITGERGAMPLLPEVAAGAPDAGTRSATRTLSWSDYYQD
jgi:phosphatidylserine/phosphatidylglycerophosphate/cardiolipin synthase-like enzyme